METVRCEALAQTMHFGAKVSREDLGRGREGAWIITSALYPSIPGLLIHRIYDSYHTCTRLISREIEGVDFTSNRYRDNRPRPVADKVHERMSRIVSKMEDAEMSMS
ncbi:hypothetical protein BHYA_0002g00030 [Botrytis hyacinthi]|uniref:Uncharacterized protein n=1 Tax=Botrytis hyacinthi TaxID=278943 RepID=A0A4Z1H412_9HELO|nr:hypothetical protein BHYA_0002g00030 [Botrytis hyacinthi]